MQMSECVVVHGWGGEACIVAHQTGLVDFFEESDGRPLPSDSTSEFYWIIILEGTRIMAVGVIDIINRIIKDILVQKYHHRQKFGSGILFHLAQMFPGQTFQAKVPEHNLKSIRFFAKYTNNTSQSSSELLPPLHYHYVFQT